MNNWANGKFLSSNARVIEALMNDLPTPGTPLSQNSHVNPLFDFSQNFDTRFRIAERLSLTYVAEIAGNTW
jgi:hypothetical protein